MMKTRIFALLLAGLLIISLAGCTGGESAEQTDGEKPKVSITADVTSDTTEKKKSDDITADKKVETESEEPTETTETEETQTATEPAKTTEPEKKTETEKPKETTPPATETPKEEPAPSTVPKATKDDCREIAQRVLEYINSYRSTPATKLTGLTQYAEYRSRQLIANFAHDTDDERAAATALAYGEYVEPALYGMTGEPYYTAGAREAIAKAGYVGTVDEVAEKLALLIKNSAKHWAYVGSADYSYIAVGVTYESGMWYCDVAMAMENTDNK